MITAVGNSKIKKIVQLNQKAKTRREENLFVAEGLKMFLEAPVEKIRDVYVSESFFKRANKEVTDKLKRCGCEEVSEEVFAKISDTKAPQGILCVMEQFHYELSDMLHASAPLLVLLENVQDPGNLGTILRTGEGAGIDGIIMSKDTADIYNPKTIRSTMGSIYRVPFFYTNSLAEMISLLKERRICLFAAHLDAKTFYYDCSFLKGSAFLIGNEGNGLQKETADLADRYVKIPMSGQVESLNAAVASALLMYEAKKQRHREERK